MRRCVGTARCLRALRLPGLVAVEGAGQVSGVMPRRIWSKIAVHCCRAAAGSSACAM